MAFKEGVILGPVSLNATGSANTGIGNSSNSGTISIGNSSSGSVNIDCGTAGINVGATANAHASVFGSSNSTSSTTVQSGTGALDIVSSNGTMTLNSGTGSLNISTDASASTISIATGAAVKNLTMGSSNTTSQTTIQSGSNPLTLTTGGGDANIVLTPNGTGVVSTANNIYGAGISFDSGVNVLDFYEEGSWTPVLQFGGGSTGITYSTQLGSYTRIGNMVRISFRITLTNKGSSTGNAGIVGLPFTSFTNNVQAFPLLTGNINLAGSYFMMLLTLTPTPGFYISYINSAGGGTVTNADFANNSQIITQGTYYLV